MNGRENRRDPFEYRRQESGGRAGREFGFAATNAGSWMEERLAFFGAAPAETGGSPNGYYAILSRRRDAVLPPLPSELEESGREDGFYLTGDENGIVIRARHPRGVIYGWRALARLSGWPGAEVEDGEALLFFNGTVIDFPDRSVRMFHMDMRYGCPSFSRMLEILEELSIWRFNAFLLEYENRFPYERRPDIRDPRGFTTEQVRTLRERAAALYIDIIPLQQTIGHLEYLLKLPQYYGLREVRSGEEPASGAKAYGYNHVGFKESDDIDEICASSEPAYAVVEDMLDDVIAAHPDSRYIHLGCDEAWNLLSCPDCRERFGASGKNRLYVGHINRMAARVLAAGKIPVVWDDMLRQFSDGELAELDRRIVVMVWLYYKSQYALAAQTVGRLRGAGLTVWGAAAAKCGEGPEPQYLDMPWYDQRLGSVELWSRVCGENALDGFCMTVWSNYSGTVAPPHPFFDTVWHPVLYAAAALWNADTGREGFDRAFCREFFGVDGIDRLFGGRAEEQMATLENVAADAVKRRYEAEVLRVMQLMSICRMKALAIGRELYKLDMDVTEAEKRIVRRRAEEVMAMRRDLEPQVRRVVETHYGAADAEVFIRSRFEADRQLFGAYGFS